jgi:hypothetical protein
MRQSARGCYLPILMLSGEFASYAKHPILFFPLLLAPPSARKKSTLSAEHA